MGGLVFIRAFALCIVLSVCRCDFVVLRFAFSHITPGAPGWAGLVKEIEAAFVFLVAVSVSSKRTKGRATERGAGRGDRGEGGGKIGPKCRDTKTNRHNNRLSEAGGHAGGQGTRPTGWEREDIPPEQANQDGKKDGLFSLSPMSYPPLCKLKFFAKRERDENEGNGSNL